MLAFLLLPLPSLAQQDTTRLPSGVRLGLTYQAVYRPTVAVRPVGGAPELTEVGAQVRAILQRDLDYSDRFEIVGVPAELSAGEIDYSMWNSLGVVFVVTGELVATNGGFQLALALHDVVYAQRKGSETFALPAANAPDFRMAVHAAADEIVRWATGQQGMAATRIAYVRRAGRDAYELMAVDSDGENAERLAFSSLMLVSPAWSPDGRRLAYAAAGEHDWRILEHDLGTRKTDVITARPGVIIYTPAYSPDGKRLAYSMVIGGGSELQDYDVEQRCCVRRLSAGRRADLSPTYSPDGQRLAFNSDRLGPPHIYVMPSDGNGEAQLLSPFVYGEPGYYTSPDWAPSGSMVAFHGRSRGLHQIMIADAARPGATVRQITAEGENEDPSWAPDARHLVFSSVRASGAGLYVMDTVTGRVRLLRGASRRQELVVPDWSSLLVRAAELAVK